jgi:hypothetical protein
MELLDKNKIEYIKISTDTGDNYIEALMHQIAVVPALRVEEEKLYTSKCKEDEIFNWIKSKIN